VTAPESLTPVGDWLDRKYGHRISTHALGSEDAPAGCAEWRAACAYGIGRAEALRQLAADLTADLTAEAKDIDELGEVPWAAMLGLRATDPALASTILRRAAELALKRAEAPPNVPALAGVPLPPASAGTHHDITERTS
jgi:hypothetical protein